MNFLDIKTKKDLCDYLSISEKEINYILYSKKIFYHTYEKNKPSGGTRIISSPNRQLKYIQRVLKKGFEEYYSTNNSFKSVHGFIANKSIATNAEKHINKDFILNLDLKDFFPSITFHRVRHLLNSKKAFNFPDNISIMIANLVTNKNKLPQGAPTSPVISNIICHNMDMYFEKWMRSHDNKITYTRYADDITFSGNLDALSLVYNKDTKELKQNIARVIAKNIFKLNTEKTRIQFYWTHQEVTGIKVNKQKNVNKHYLYKLRSLVHSWEKFGLNNSYKVYCQKNHLKYDENNSNDYIRIVLGMLSYLKMIKGYDDQVYVSLALRVNTLLKKTLVEFKSSYDDIKTQAVYQLYGNLSCDIGTCFRVKDYLITCKHCVESDDPLETYRILKGNHTIENNLKILYKSNQHDLALLSAKNLYELPYINFAKTSIEKREQVNILGYPMSEEYDDITEQQGQVTNFLNLSGPNIDKDYYITIAAAIQEGNSGGPVLNKDNDLVGMVCIGNENPATNNRNGSLPIDIILKEIDIYEKKTKKS